MLRRIALAVLATIVAAAAAGGVALPLLRRRYLRVAVAGESMTPALRPGDFLVLRRGPPPAEAAAGHVVAVYDPRHTGRLDPPGNGGHEALREVPPQPDAEPPPLLLKRIVGLPGESLRIGGGVQVNGRVLEEPYAHGETPAEQHRGINRLEEDEYFLVGDHRGASTDSRDFGPVRRQDIVGTVVLRYWPPERLGRVAPEERRLLGTADRPGPGAKPLPWLEQRETPVTPVTPPSAEAASSEPQAGEGNP
ncbi:MAG: signal peptidase I [Dehalococcoidia bacterium]|nr:signal peptidase I [Dehalococcoidia bacterium]